MKLKKEFSDFYSDIRIDKEANSLREKREILVRDIKTKLPKILCDHDIHITQNDIRTIDQGSYKYNTTIKSDVVDRDVAVIISISSDEMCDPRKFKGYLCDSIDIPSRKVEIKEPCVRVSYHEHGVEKIHIDLPLYAQIGTDIYLARGKSNGSIYSWEDADPDGLNDYLCGKINGNDQLRRIICFIKKWRDEKYANANNDHEIPPSIGLTILACKLFSPQSDNEGDADLLALQKTMKAILNEFIVSKTITGEIMSAEISCPLPVRPYTDTFKKMKNSSDSYMIKFYNSLSRAVADLTDAINVESPHDAGVYVQKVLGNDFPIPQKEASYASTRNYREHSFG